MILSFSQPHAFAQTNTAEIPDPAFLREKLESIRAANGLPALACAVVVQDKIVAASAVGVRKLGDPTPVTREDRFHLGSIAKPMTATLVGICVQQKILSWDTTVAQMFPELVATMQPAYRNVTVAQLLAHLSGLPTEPTTPENITDARALNVTGRRYEYVKAALADPPVAPPGTTTHYGGGAILVVCYLERKLGLSYEELMRREVFTPLGMTTARFGETASVNAIDGPWPHDFVSGKFVPIAATGDQALQTRAPVGRNIVCSVIDLARFAAVHLDGAHGRSAYLAPETFARLQTSVPGGDDAPGWMIAPTSWPWAGKNALWHNGGNGRNDAHCTICPEKDFAVCVMTNAGNDAADKACDLIQDFVGQNIQKFHALPTAPAASH